MLKTFRKGGIHPYDAKLTAGKEIVDVIPSGIVRIMLSQSIGAPSKPVVKVGDRVAKNQLIAEASSFVSSNIHSPVNGTVKKMEPVRNLQGIWQEAILIECDAPDAEPVAVEKPVKRNADEVKVLSSQEIIDIVRAAGIVGLGGATFPTAVKLTPPKGKSFDTVIINGAECEPYLTCDDALMRANPLEIILGAELLMRACGASKVVIGIEDNKKEAFEAISSNIPAGSPVSAVLLKKKYPQGGEKQLIEALTGKRVPEGGLPADVGALVDNVATAFSVWNAVYNGLPLTERVLTVTGPDLTNPGNFRVPIGVSVDTLIDVAGGLPQDTGKVIAGGPMMGRAISNTDSPSTKGMSGLVIVPEKDSTRGDVGPCIRCAKCVEVCPMGLEPYLVAVMGINKLWIEARDHGALSCLECGCCSYICPSNRPILDYIKLSRQEIRKLPR